MTASSVRPDVVAFVAAVRAHLDDLDPVEVEELTGGLAADLTDAAADHQGPLEPRFGAPQAYADELRAAAGLAPRGSRRPQSHVAELRRSLADLAAPLRAHPQWPAVSAFLLTIRPVWWVLRALVAAWLLMGLAGTTVGIVGLALTVALVVVSVELGRGRWSGRRGLAPLVLLGNVLAAVLVLPMLANLSDGGEVIYSSASDDSQPGLNRDGRPVTNVFAYDAQGRPLRDVQLYDQTGQPLAVDPGVATTWDETGGTIAPVPASDVYGRQLFNVYPLAQQAQGLLDDGSGVVSAPPTPTLPVPPLVAVAPVRTVAAGDGGGAPTSGATDPARSPTESSTATASPAPTGVPTAGTTTRPFDVPTTGPTTSPTTAPTSAAPTSQLTGTPAPRPSATP